MQELTIKQKLTNYYYFVIFNSILACIICAGYWFHGSINFCMPMPKLTDWLDLLYIITTHFSVITLLTFLVSLTLLPAIYLSHKKYLLVQSIVASIFIGILIFDIGVFYTDNIHLINIDINLLINALSDKNIMLSINKIIAYIVFIIFIALIYFTNIQINKTNWFINNKIITKFSILLLASSVISLLTYALNTKEKQRQLLAYMQYFPLCKNSDAITSMYKQVKYGKLQYPVKPLQATAIINPPNILIIAMDAWRADCFNKDNSPNLWQFAQNGKIFTNHFSGGNHTSSGLFSLFYGISSSYVSIFKKQKIPTLFFSRLKQLGYQINSFTTNNKDGWLKFYTDIENLHILSSKITRQYKKDKQLTKNYLGWHQNLNKDKPWFSFIFYDSLHGPDFPENYSTTTNPAIEVRNYKEFANKVGKQGFINSYKTSVHYIDSLANKILQQLIDTNDLENTIVIITADHGCEWDDNNQGIYGYWSNFTDCQVKVPLAIILPKQFQEQLINQQYKLTTHYDIVPTLMYNFLGVTNNIADYSIGNDLLNNNHTQEWCLACSQGQYITVRTAIIKDNQMLKFNSNYTLIDQFNNIIFSNNKTSMQYLNQAIEYMTRFIKK